MSKDSPASKRNELGPDLMGYYKHILLELFSEKEGLISPIFPSSELSKGDLRRVEGTQTQEKGGIWVGDSFELFAEGIGNGFTDDKKDRLRAIIHETATFLNQEADEVLDKILATLQIRSDLGNRLLTSCPSGCDEEMIAPIRSKKRKASSPAASCSPEGSYDLPSAETLERVIHFLGRGISCLPLSANLLQGYKISSNNALFPELICVVN